MSRAVLVAIQNRRPSQNVRDGLAYVPQGSRVFADLTLSKLELKIVTGIKGSDERDDAVWKGIQFGGVAGTMVFE